MTDFFNPVTRADRTRREAEGWTQYFSQALDGRGQEHTNTLWWRIASRDCVELVRGLHLPRTPARVLESGCGAGTDSIALASLPEINQVLLLDITRAALSFARSQVPPSVEGVVHLLQGDAFTLPFRDRTFDLIWNVGVVEHYPSDDLIALVAEMLRVTVRGGVVIIGIPNRNSVPALKAYLLGTRIGRRILPRARGYRFDTEILYWNRELAALIETNCGTSVDVRFGGSCLWAGAPEPLVRFLDRVGRGSPLSFLTFFVMRKR